MLRQAVCGLLLAAITLAVQASEDPTESLAGVHDLSKSITFAQTIVMLIAVSRPTFSG